MGSDGSNNEELRNIKYEIGELKDKLVGINESIRSLGDSYNLQLMVKFFAIVGFFASISIISGVSKQKYDKVIVYNDDNAIIFDCDDGIIEEEDCSVIYVDEDKGISANDIAVSLVGEDGNVYYYNSETKEKTLINK